ncbi:hypothetical protein PHJA_001848300 [Phtheirospermum japonicum]|uniref:Uncharacterized protein n=1 Tax=Phtheirospermum japonicum TaxID=374723 RepID=A0A830CFF9_9LAMI|nr:hypothetical protein PHJA_001848300 [Phtheirospermum japonicum]
MQPVDASMEHNCIPDEHYVQTLLTHKGLEGEITRRSLTHSSWDLSSSRDPQRRGWHPMTYKLADATPNLIQSIKVPASESQYDDNYYPMDDKYNGLFHSQTGTQSSETQRSCQRQKSNMHRSEDPYQMVWMGQKQVVRKRKREPVKDQVKDESQKSPKVAELAAQKSPKVAEPVAQADERMEDDERAVKKPKAQISAANDELVLSRGVKKRKAQISPADDQVVLSRGVKKTMKNKSNAEMEDDESRALLLHAGRRNSSSPQAGLPVAASSSNFRPLSGRRHCREEQSLPNSAATAVASLRAVAASAPACRPLRRLRPSEKINVIEEFLRATDKFWASDTVADLCDDEISKFILMRKLNEDIPTFHLLPPELRTPVCKETKEVDNVDEGLDAAKMSASARQHNHSSEVYGPLSDEACTAAKNIGYLSSFMSQNKRLMVDVDEREKQVIDFCLFDAESFYDEM